MKIIQCCSVFCLLLLLPSGTGIVTKSVCRGDSLALFENILDSRDTNVSLYINHHTHILMAQWDVQNSTIMPRIQPEYEEKVYFSKDGSVWIHNVIQRDEEKYFIEYGRHSPYVKYEAEIHIKDAPTTRCKPKITHWEKILIASLESEDCGTPVVSVQWLDHPGISTTSERVINLTPENDTGTYYACLKGPALECAKISTLSDYCSSYTIRGGISHDTTTAQSPKNETEGSFIAVSTVVLMGTLAVVIVVMTVMLLHIKCQHYHSKKETENEQTMTLMQKPSITELEVLNGEYPQLWESHFGNLKWENIVQLLNSDQQQGLRRYCEDLNEEYPQLWRSHFGNLKWENILELLNGDQQQGLRRYCEDLIEEYPQLWGSHFAKLKWENIVQLLNVYQWQGLQKHCYAVAEKIKDREPKKKQKQKMMERTGKATKDVYKYLSANKSFDPNVLE